MTLGTLALIILLVIYVVSHVVLILKIETTEYAGLIFAIFLGVDVAIMVVIIVETIIEYWNIIII